jgi:hypothetical protein
MHLAPRCKGCAADWAALPTPHFCRRKIRIWPSNGPYKRWELEYILGIPYRRIWASLKFGSRSTCAKRVRGTLIGVELSGQGVKRNI